MEWINAAVNWYIANINYGTITLLMAAESSILPFPSEAIVPPAAWKAADGDLNIVLVVVFSVIGNILGASVMYLLSRWLGRGIIYGFARTRLARFLMIDEAKLHKAEAYFVKHGKSATFIGRLVPVVRHLISIPAGLAKMPMPTFVLYTALGSTVWNIILAALGYAIYTQRDALHQYYDEISIVGVILCVLFIAYLIVRAVRKPKKKADAAGANGSQQTTAESANQTADSEPAADSVKK
jgi:membrane protein DedA with SNARE-associated domain